MKSGLIAIAVCGVLIAAAANAKDKVDLEGAKIRGNKELPKVLYIVPWKKAPVGDLVGRPVESLLDEVLAPIDKEVFKREVDYFESLKEEHLARSRNK